MHAVRGTIGYDPNPVDKAAKNASRARHFGYDNQDVWQASWGTGNDKATVNVPADKVPALLDALRGVTSVITLSRG